MTKIKRIIEQADVQGVRFVLLETDEKGNQRFAAVWGRPKNLEGKVWGRPKNLEGKAGDTLMVECITKKQASFRDGAGHSKIVLDTLPACKKRYDAMVRNAELVTFVKV